jgi:hypothetical protein
VPDTDIRYTLDGTVPSETSSLYAAALTISQTATPARPGVQAELDAE